MRGARRKLFAAAAALALLGGGCQATSSSAVAPKTPAEAVGSQSLVWPAPPAPSRIRYVRSISEPKDLGIRKSFLRQFIEAVLGKEEGRLVRPTGVAERDGIVYIADPGAPALWIFDSQKQASVVVRQAGNSPLLSPVAVAAAQNGRVFLADSRARKVFLLDRNGKLLRVISGEGLKRPVALAYDDERDRLYVADSLGQQVVVYSSDARKLFAWGGRGTADGQFNYPSYLALAGSQTVLVTDALNYRVQAFDSRGNFLWKFGRQGDGAGDFAAPKGVATDSRGHIYMVDALFDAIQIFDRDGKLLLPFGQHGRAPGEFSLPTGIFIDGSDRIYVADSYNHRIQVFQFLGAPASPRSEASQRP